MASKYDKRAKIDKDTETLVLMASRRKCCLCYFLNDVTQEQRGQIAHLNHDRSNSSFHNLVWLCLHHHDAFDSKTSQSKGYTVKEVEKYRDLLYEKLGTGNFPSSYEDSNSQGLQIDHLFWLPEWALKLISQSEGNLDFMLHPWRSIWQTPEEPELFAYRSSNMFDGICLIERVDLPDGRIVIICEEINGNPGQSVTNAVEEIAFQVCSRFDIEPENLIWIEHYDTWFDGEDEWDLVTFEQMPPDAYFEKPSWKRMSEQDWHSLGLLPRKRARNAKRDIPSRIRWKKP